MTNATQAPVSWNSLAGFGGTIENDATAFADAVGGASFALGTNKGGVKIDVPELKQSKAGNFYLKLNIVGPNEEKINTNVMLSAGKDGKGFHFTYTRLAAAVIGDAELRMRFFKACSQNPALLDGLRGMKVGIVVGKGKEGYVVEESPLGGKVVIDVATGAEYPEFAGRKFESYSEIKDACKEYSIKRMYNEVTNVVKPTDEELAENEQAVSEILRSLEAQAASKAATTSRAARPTRTI